MNKARLESFSDGVFAFAITLLVLGVPIPQLRSPEDSALRAALIQSLSQLVPYITSFATIGIIWLNHHELFNPVRKVDHAALTLNLLLLLIVSFIPYPTAVLSRFGPMPSSSFLYGLVLTLVGVVYSLLAFHLKRNCLDADVRTELRMNQRKWRNIIGTLTYPLAALLALKWPRVSVAIYFLLAAFYFLPDRKATSSRLSE